jgi:hypothetical protein
VEENSLQTQCELPQALPALPDETSLVLTKCETHENCSGEDYGRQKCVNGYCSCIEDIVDSVTGEITIVTENGCEAGSEQNKCFGNGFCGCRDDDSCSDGETCGITCGVSIEVATCGLQTSRNWYCQDQSADATCNGATAKCEAKLGNYCNNEIFICADDNSCITNTNSGFGVCTGVNEVL